MKIERFEDSERKGTAASCGFTLIELLICQPTCPPNPAQGGRRWKSRLAGRRQVQGAFTLIELLVVIAIIALMAVLLSPALESARKQSRGVKCLSNLKQLGVSISLYLNDHNSSFPPSYDATTGAFWGGILWNKSYLGGSAVIFQCPALQQTYPDFTTVTAATSPTDGAFNYTPYGMNPELGPGWHEGNSIARADEIVRSGETILLADSICPGLLPTQIRGYYLLNSTGGLDYVPHGRHHSRVNILWVDQHASGFAVSDPLNPYPELTRWQDSPSHWRRN